MFQSIFNSLFGCSHQRTTFPITPGRKPNQQNAGISAPGGARSGTYVVCLACGKEFAYNWEAMQIGQPVGTRVPATGAQPVRA
jgi:hypothetical protein